jgi:hypothetical protein
MVEIRGEGVIEERGGEGITRPTQTKGESPKGVARQGKRRRRKKKEG